MRNAEWALQYDELVASYLVYQEQGGISAEPGPPMVPIDSEMFDMDVVDTFCTYLHFSCVQILTVTIDRKQYMFLRLPNDLYTNTMLLRYGYLGSSPLHPTIAISILTLAEYRQTHRVCPRFSIQAQVRKLCHLHNVSEYFNTRNLTD